MNVTLRDLLDLPRVQAMLDSLNRICSFPSAIIDNESNILTASGWQDMCTRFHRVHPSTSRDCQESDRYILGRLDKARPSVTYRCPRGLIDSAIPIVIDGQHLGSVFTGQMFLEKPDMAFFRDQAQRYGFDEQAYLEAVAKIPVLTREKLDEILLFIRDFAQFLGEIALHEKKAAADKQRAALLAETNRVKDIFTDVLRHDILTPVQTIRITAHLLGVHEVDAQKTKLLQRIQRSVSSLTEMAQNAAEYARLAAMEAPQFATLDLQRCIGTTLEDHELLLKERDVRVNFAARQSAPAALNPMIREVFANLISNAIKYSPPHGTIEISINDQPETWLVAIEDSGEGIPDEDKERVFNRFERLGKEGVKGSGLGLAIARQIVTMHRGTIWIQDNPTGGSVFFVRLPKVQPVVEEDSENPGSEKGSIIASLPLSAIRHLRKGAGAGGLPPSPKQNHILAALPTEDYARLLPHLQLVSMPQGWGVKTGGSYVYFPITSIVSRRHITQDGASAEIAVIGNEGLLGMSLFLGGETMPGQSIVLSAGHGYRLNANVLKRDLALGTSLQHLALRYMQALVIQMAQTSVCSRHHKVKQRLCRWLLMSLDRGTGSELETTQETIADSLGVRREGISEAAAKLQADGVIHYSRGHVSVLNRVKLEQCACECYGVVKKEYDRLLPYRLYSAESSALHALRS